MISPIDIYRKRNGELCAGNDPQAAFLVVRKGCFIHDGEAKRLKLQEHIDSQTKTFALKIVPEIPTEPVKSLQVARVPRAKKTRRKKK